jgi:large subunit ribosomal protein L13
MNKTFIPSSTFIKRKWYLIDATNKTLGRISTEIAIILQGKNKISFYPATDMGDYVVIINAKEIQLTGNKEEQKLYYRHSGRPGGLKIETLKSLRKRIPTKILERSIRGMLPKGPLGRTMFNRLKVFEENTHPHIAQNPQLF